MGGEGSRAHHPQLHFRGPAPLAGTGGRSSPGRTGQCLGRCLHGDGRATEFHLRPLPAGHRAKGRRTNRLGRIQRGGLRQQRAGRAHAEVPGLPRYLHRPVRTGTVDRLPSRRPAQGPADRRCAGAGSRGRQFLSAAGLSHRQPGGPAHPADTWAGTRRAHPGRPQGLWCRVRHHQRRAVVPHRRGNAGSPRPGRCPGERRQLAAGKRRCRRPACQLA
ncbi:hypothetical protein D3C84_816930 [compost metagenome]